MKMYAIRDINLASDFAITPTATKTRPELSNNPQALDMDNDHDHDSRQARNCPSA